MESEGVRLAGRQLLLAEELALLAIGERGGSFPGTPQLEAALAGAILIELRERSIIGIGPDRLTNIERWPTGDTLLDQIVAELVLCARSVRQDLERIARSAIAVTIVERLERRALVSRHRDTVLGVIPITRYTVVPPRFQLHWRVRINGIIRENTVPDAREHALLPLLAATRLLRGSVEHAERGRAARIADDLGRDDPVQQAVVRTIALIEAGEAAVTVAATA